MHSTFDHAGAPAVALVQGREGLEDCQMWKSTRHGAGGGLPIWNKRRHEIFQTRRRPHGTVAFFRGVRGAKGRGCQNVEIHEDICFSDLQGTQGFNRFQCVKCSRSLTPGKPPDYQSTNWLLLRLYAFPNECYSSIEKTLKF